MSVWGQNIKNRLRITNCGRGLQTGVGQGITNQGRDALHTGPERDYKPGQVRGL